MKLIRTEEAVGHVLCHDMTQIIPGVYKDARFRKGHIVTAEDITQAKGGNFFICSANGQTPQDDPSLRDQPACR